MSSIVIKGNTSGQIELAAPDVAGSTTLTLPTGTGTVLLSNGDGSALTGISSLGVGQTWTNVTSSRAIATTYTNTTGKPIFVVISCTGNGVNGLFGVQVGGSTIMFSPSTASNGHWSSVSFVVPNGSTYATNQQGANVTLGLWWELR